VLLKAILSPAWHLNNSLILFHSARSISNHFVLINQKALVLLGMVFNIYFSLSLHQIKNQIQVHLGMLLDQIAFASSG